MKPEIDVLIIFSSHDNDAPDKGESGWVSQFKRFLELMLTQVLGEKPNILLKDEVDSLTSPKLDNVAVLVTILSKSFIESGQCLDYVEMFFNATQGTPRKINRAIKVFKNQLTLHEQPPRLRELNGYEMYQLDPYSGEVSEYTDYFSSYAERQYWMKMVDLAYDIYDSLLQLKGENSKANMYHLFKRKTIYLAETGHDMMVQRTIIKRELQKNGYLVLPNQGLVGSNAAVEKLIREELQECSLSIHLIGAAYGEIPEGANQSVPELQLLLSLEQARQSSKFSRLVWISPGLSHVSDRQKNFIERIKADLESHENTEIFEMPIEDFKAIMRDELLDQHDREPIPKDDLPSIYLMHDKIDHEYVKPFAEMIESSGFRVLVPAFEGDVMDLRKKHFENLINFDAALIFKGKVSEQWVRMKVLDLLKAPGFGRGKRIIGKAIITAPDSSINAETFKSQGLRLIQGDLQKSLESLKSFLQEFEN